MSDLRQAAEQALNALERGETKLRYAAITALKTALAEPQQEPVAWMYHGIRHDDTLHDRPSLIWRPEYMDAMSAGKGAKATPLYTDPPPRQPLTDEEIGLLTTGDGWSHLETPALAKFARAIEAAHSIGEKNK